MHWTGHHQLDRVLGPLAKKLSFFMCVKKLSFGIAYKVATYWKQYRLRLAIIYLHQASMLQGNMCIPSWNRGISDLSMSKQVDLTGNYAANWTTLLVANKPKQVVTTTNDWCNFDDIHCSKQIMTTHDPLYMIVLQALSVLAWRFLQALVTPYPREAFEYHWWESRGNAIYSMDEIVWYLVSHFVKKTYIIDDHCA